MKSASDKSGAGEFLFGIALLLFPPAALATLLIYVVMRALHCPRPMCMVASLSVGAALALAQIVLIAAVLITGEPLF